MNSDETHRPAESILERLPRPVPRGAGAAALHRRRAAVRGQQDHRLRHAAAAGGAGIGAVGVRLAGKRAGSRALKHRLPAHATGRRPVRPTGGHGGGPGRVGGGEDAHPGDAAGRKGHRLRESAGGNPGPPAPARVLDALRSRDDHRRHPEPAPVEGGSLSGRLA